ncbi:MAG: hypothetical protein V1792_07205 [Pseudomonadota bacterium]
MWNDSPECRALAEGQLVAQPTRELPLDRHLVQQGLVFLTGAASGMIIGVLKDVIKEDVPGLLQMKLPRERSGKSEWVCVIRRQ